MGADHSRLATLAFFPATKNTLVDSPIADNFSVDKKVLPTLIRSVKKEAVG